jgi:arylsulfatase A-like enzyme
MGEHGYYFRHGDFLHEPQIRVPLIIKMPGTKPKRVAKIVEHIDLGPTILDLFGLETPSEFQGKSLLPLTDSKNGGWEELAYSQLWRDENLALINGRMKLVHFRGHKALYDLRKDPGEREDIYRKRPRKVKRRLEQKMKFYRNFAPKTPIVPKRLIDHKTKETLKTLGYIK